MKYLLATILLACTYPAFTQPTAEDMLRHRIDYRKKTVLTMVAMYRYAIEKDSARVDIHEYANGSCVYYFAGTEQDKCLVE